MGDRTLLLVLWFAMFFGASRIGMSSWMLKSDKRDENNSEQPQSGALLTTLVASFTAKIGDKTPDCYGRAGRRLLEPLCRRRRYDLRPARGQCVRSMT